MNPTAILWPIGALAILTFAVLLVVPYRRFKAAFARQVRAEDFRYGESNNVPGEVRIPNRNYMNLLESPNLFYVACILFYVTDLVDVQAVSMAWLYVALRTAHSIVHLTYNKVMHRMIAFAASITVLVAMWVHLLLSLPAA
jgi:hypothetical protein